MLQLEYKLDGIQILVPTGIAVGTSDGLANVSWLIKYELQVLIEANDWPDLMVQ